MTIIRTNSRANVLSYVLYGCGCLVFFVPIIIIVEGLYGLDNVLIALSLVGIIGTPCIRALLWFVKGEEIVKIENEKLIVLKNGSFWFKRNLQIPLNEIDSIETIGNFHERNSPSNLVGSFSRQGYIFKLQNTGRISLSMKNGKNYRILDSISLDKASEIVEIVKREVS